MPHPRGSINNVLVLLAVAFVNILCPRVRSSVITLSAKVAADICKEYGCSAESSLSTVALGSLRRRTLFASQNPARIEATKTRSKLKAPGPSKLLSVGAAQGGIDSSLLAMFIKTKSGPLYYEVAGDGAPLVFVSGWAMSSECWRPAVASLKRKHRCLVYDSRGVGRSQPSSIDADFTIEGHAEDLHSILEAAEIFDAAIVGHEMGSLVGAANAIRHPQDARSLIVVSPRAGMSQDDVRNLAVFTPASLALRELAAYPLLRNLVGRRFRRAPQPYRDRLFNDFADLSPRAAYETALSASSEESVAILEGLIRRTSSPVLFICGEKDKKGATEARRLFSRARAGKLATMRDCGFLPMLEYRRQFVRLVEEFVADERDAANRRSIQRS